MSAITSAVKDFIRHPRDNGGRTPRALLMTDGESLCATCTRDHFRLIVRADRTGDQTGGWRPAAVYTLAPNESICCAHCSADIEPAYTRPVCRACNSTGREPGTNGQSVCRYCQGESE